MNAVDVLYRACADYSRSIFDCNTVHLTLIQFYMVSVMISLTEFCCHVGGINLARLLDKPVFFILTTPNNGHVGHDIPGYS